ncbi:hypothetical protein G8E10_04910 [Rhizobiaceae bacterium CRRU44]|uniref:Uncharacterized protein n=1 Tax=Ferranicluibacter rubi TaxID=2715133 RepID=A0AA43ZDX3_9HYPH|nr:hypothetical protein [Ferranicluibacter rubi]NHT75097.1 hypothetical protein [Ferranicluibacter rubi]
MVNNKVIFADVEDPLCAAANHAVLANEFVWNLLRENKGLGSLSEHRITAACSVLETAETAALEARDVYYAAFAQNDAAAFGKVEPASDASVVTPAAPDALNAAAGLAELLYLGAKALQDDHERAAMTEGVFQLLTMLKEAGL